MLSWDEANDVVAEFAVSPRLMQLALALVELVERVSALSRLPSRSTQGAQDNSCAYNYYRNPGRIRAKCTWVILIIAEARGISYEPMRADGVRHAGSPRQTALSC